MNAKLNKIVSAQKLGVAWLETRTEKDMKLFKKLVKTTHDIIDVAFSEKVIEPGKTTTEDVVWFLRQTVTDMGLETWFHPTIDVQRNKEVLKSHIESFSKGKEEQIIQKGDLLHVDIGVTFARFNTDQQQHAYVLKAGETQVPEGLQKALKTGNRLQDILMSNFKIGLSGNIVLKNSREQAINEGIKPSIYTHPLGFYGHASGPTIGMWDNQGDTKGAGDYPVFANTGYSIELNVSVQIPEWNNKEIRIMLEEDAFFDGKSVRFYDGRQEDIILID